MPEQLPSGLGGGAKTCQGEAGIAACCKLESMVSPQPIHSDRHRGSTLHMLSPVIAVVLVATGLLAGDLVTLAFGVVLSLFLWLTRPRRYEVFRDSLVINYGTQRRKILPLAEIEEVHLIRFPLGGQGLLVRRRRGLGMVIRPTDPERFLAWLEDARRGLGG